MPHTPTCLLINTSLLNADTGTGCLCVTLLIFLDSNCDRYHVSSPLDVLSILQFSRNLLSYQGTAVPPPGLHIYGASLRPPPREGSV